MTSGPDRPAAPPPRPPSQDPALDETKRLKRELDELSALFVITKRLRKPFELSQLLDEILDICRQLLDAEAASLLLLDREKKVLNFIAVQGGPEEEIKKIPPIPLGQGIAGWVAQAGRSAVVNDTSRDSRFGGWVDRVTRFVTRSVLAAPLRADVGEETLGVLEVINKREGRHFTPSDQRLFEMMAEQAAVALQHVRQEDARREADRMATIGRMASSIIHDLKNPMTAIKGFAELIRERSPENQRFAEIIMREIDRLVGMTQELLAFTRGTPKLQLAKVRTASFLRDAIEFLAGDFERAKVELVSSVRWDGEFEADPDKLRRALFNLAGNARDAMPGGGRFTIECDREGEGVALQFSDTGIGMDEETLASCFQPFYTKGKDHGTGLGLSIVKSIVEAHGGKIQVKSAPGQGTRFHLWFPLANSAS